MAQGGGRGDSCFGGDYGDDAAELKLGEAERRENPALAEKRVEFFRGLVAGAAVEKSELLALSLSLERTTRSSAGSAIATTSCAAVARAAGARWGGEPSRGWAPKVDGVGSCGALGM